jgi:hypothetical protein
MSPKKIYWWTDKEEYKFEGDHEGDCEGCGDESTLNDNNVCEECYTIFMNEDEDF